MSLLGRIRALLGGGDSPAPTARTCKRGHSVCGENAYVRPDGRGIECRACRKRAMARRTTSTTQPANGHAQEG